MRVAINLLTDDPANPSGAHWFWTRVIPEMAGAPERRRGAPPAGQPEVAAHAHRATGTGSATSPSRGRTRARTQRTLSEHLYAPVRLPLGRIDVFSTLMAPARQRRPGAGRRTSRRCTRSPRPRRSGPLARLYRQMSYPRTAKVADAIIINSESLRAEVQQYLDVDPAKLRLIPEAVDHDLFRPGDADEARRPRARAGTA